MADEVKISCPPAYTMSSMPEVVVDKAQRKSSCKSKSLFGYAVAVTTCLIVVVIMGGVYYYRSLDVLEATLRKFKTVDDSGNKPVTQDIEIDTVNNVVVFRLSGDGIAAGTYAVLDYTKSLTGIYDPEAQKCYVIPGIDSRIISPTTLLNNLASNNNTQPYAAQSLHYVLASSYPVTDKSILPAPLKSACALLPVYWMEKDNAADLSRVKRFKISISFHVWIFDVTISATF